ncbi:MAG: metallophosphoesterase [Dehalococcoidia bacterium]|nr:metallophosphoesterase [Dehalococcoidia bacterium]
MNTRKLTILHSNDMHGDFLAEKTSVDAKARMIGGLALLSGYVNQVRQEEENVLYLIAGDMVNGAQLRRTFAHIMRKENRDGEGECYQVNRAVKAIYDEQGEQLVSLTVNGQDVSDSGMYTICMLGYHFKNSKAYMDITADELNETGQAKVVSTSAQEVMEEYLRAHPNAESRVEGRLVYR